MGIVCLDGLQDTLQTTPHTLPYPSQCLGPGLDWIGLDWIAASLSSKQHHTVASRRIARPTQFRARGPHQPSSPFARFPVSFKTKRGLPGGLNESRSQNPLHHHIVCTFSGFSLDPVTALCPPPASTAPDPVPSHTHDRCSWASASWCPPPPSFSPLPVLHCPAPECARSAASCRRHKTRKSPHTVPSWRESPVQPRLTLHILSSPFTTTRIGSQSAGSATASPIDPHQLLRIASLPSSLRLTLSRCTASAKRTNPQPNSCIFYAHACSLPNSPASQSPPLPPQPV